MEGPKEEGPKLYRRRWVVLGVFCALRFVSESCWITFAPVSSVVQQAFNVSATEVNLLSSVYFATYVVLALPAAWAMERFGLRVGLSVSAGVLCVGTFLRFAGTLSSSLFWLMFCGQTVASLSQLFTLQSASAVSGRWFGGKERTLSTSLGYVLGIAGNLVAFLVCPAVATDRVTLGWVLLTQALYVTVTLVACIVLVRDLPPTPPSVAAACIHHHHHQSPAPLASTTEAEDGREEKEKKADDVNGEKAKEGKRSVKVAALEMWAALKVLFTNCGFIWALASVSLITTAYWILQTVAEQVLVPDGFTSVQSGIVIAVNVGVGCLGTFLISPLVDRTRRYVEINAALAFASSLGFAAMLTLSRLVTNAAVRMGTVCVASAIAGVAMTAIAPVGFELAVELTFPLAESFSSSMIMIFSNLFSFIGMFPIDALRESNGRRLPAMLFIEAISIAGFLCALPIRRNYRRLQYEQNASASSPVPQSESSAVVESPSIELQPR